jgi:endonuclease/exonuclease/phosphatase family metal-dependent hydrolase
MQLKVIFANILGGREFLGNTYGEINFGDTVLDTYIQAIADQKPDILSVAEVHLEDETHSAMVSELSRQLGLPYYDFMGSDESHLAEGKILGNAILSQYPITKTEHFIVEAPRIEVDRPNGDHWVLHNKLAQTAWIKTDDKTIAFTSLHYFPFHHFNRKMNDPEFLPQREGLAEHLTKTDSSTIPIITGDFNNKNFKLVEAFPELFDTGFSEAVELTSSIIGGEEQLDHILYRKSDALITNSGSFAIPSDHVGLYASIQIL